MRLQEGCIEVAFAHCHDDVPVSVRRCAFGGITLGHVIIAQSHEGLDTFRAHEQVHVCQYERWGVAFLLAYPLASLWALLTGRHPYWDNVFEVEAYRLAPASTCPVPVDRDASGSR